MTTKDTPIPSASSTEASKPAAGRCAVATGSPAGDAYPTAEAYFIDQDRFLGYVHNVVNIARLREGLNVISDSHARRCFDIITSRIYRQPIGKQENELFSPETAAVDSPRLAWMKKHGIRTHHNPLSGVLTHLQWEAWLPDHRYDGLYFGTTEDEALAALAKAHDLKLWNEEGA